MFFKNLCVQEEGKRAQLATSKKEASPRQQTEKRIWHSKGSENTDMAENKQDGTVLTSAPAKTQNLGERDVSLPWRHMEVLLDSATTHTPNSFEDRGALKVRVSVQQVPIKEASLDKDVGMPRHMRPRPLGFEEDSQFSMYAARRGICQHEGDDAKEASVPVMDGKTSMNNRSEQVTSAKDSGKLIEPSPPGTVSSGVTSFLGRRISKESQQDNRRHHEHKEMPVQDRNCGEGDRSLSLMNLFFPSVDTGEPNNRRLPAENDRWGFHGDSNARAHSPFLPVSSPEEMGTLPMGLIQSLVERRDVDAAVAATPRIVIASKHR